MEKIEFSKFTCDVAWNQGFGQLFSLAVNVSVNRLGPGNFNTAIIQDQVFFGGLISSFCSSTRVEMDKSIVFGFFHLKSGTYFVKYGQN